MADMQENRRKRLYDIIEIGHDGDRISTAYDAVNVLSVLLNLTASILLTFENVALRYGGLLESVENVTVVFFAVDYILRLWTADCLYPGNSRKEAVFRYMRSFMGIVDLLSFLPYCLPAVVPSGLAVFRMFRVVRIFRLFRINVYYDSLNVITEVLASKKQQLLSSVFIILVLMVSSSLAMYSIEHEAQPEVFENAFSGIWWSVSTLLTVGYGDIYPITTLGQIFGIIISFLGVGMVAIPTGIISAGFVDQYSRVKRLGEMGNEENIRFIRIHLAENDDWRGKRIRDLKFPHGVIIAAIQRKEGMIIPRGDVVLEAGDSLVLGAETYRDDTRIELKEIVLKGQNPWIGTQIKDLDISRKTLIVMVRRKDRSLLPHGDVELQEGDAVILYTQRHLRDAERIIV